MANTTPKWPNLAPEASKDMKMMAGLPRIHSGMVPRVSRHRRFPYVFLVKHTHFPCRGFCADARNNENDTRMARSRPGDVQNDENEVGSQPDLSRI